jgi:tRNA pseudouridine55 synthase
MSEKINGIVIVDKQAGMTSFDVVSAMRRITGERRIGHAGTLDPMATGVLPVFLGSATKAIGQLPCQDKRYEATFRLGVTTDTGDSTGHVLSTMPVHVSAEEVARTAQSLYGNILQVPPMYSAIKQNGRRLYKLARQGIDVERQPRQINIYEITLGACNMLTGDYPLEVFCSKGTYIRTIITDIGDKLGCGGVMTSLRRTFAAGFAIDKALKLDVLAAAATEGSLSNCILDIETPFLDLCETQVTEKQAVRFKNGGALSLDRLDAVPQQGCCRVKYGTEFLGLGAVDEEKRELCIQSLFARRDA